MQGKTLIQPLPAALVFIHDLEAQPYLGQDKAKSVTIREKKIEQVHDRLTENNAKDAILIMLQQIEYLETFQFNLDYLGQDTANDVTLGCFAEESETG